MRFHSLFFVIGLLFLYPINESAAAIPSQERSALIDLYNSTDGDNWKKNSGWKGNNNLQH